MNTVIFTKHDNVPVSSRQGRPLTGGLSVPRKSGPFDTPFDRLRAMSKVEWLMVLSEVEGHTRNADLTIVYHGGRCPDLSGSAGALRIGHEINPDKKRYPHALP